MVSVQFSVTQMLYWREAAVFTEWQICACADECVYLWVLFCYCFPYIFNKFKTPSYDWQKRSQKYYLKFRKRQPFTAIFPAKI